MSNWCLRSAFDFQSNYIYNDFRGIVEQMPLKIQVEPDLWLPFSCNLANEDINKGDYEHAVLL